MKKASESKLVSRETHFYFDCVLCAHPKLRADGGLASGCSHLLLVVPAAHLLKKVVDEVQPSGKIVMFCFVFQDFCCVRHTLS